MESQRVRNDSETFTFWVVNILLYERAHFFIAEAHLLLFSDYVVPKSLWPHGLQHASPLCPPPSSGVCSDLCPLNQWCCLTSHPLPPSFPFAFNLSQHQSLFQWVSFCIRWSKYWSFSFSVSPSNDYSGLISFRIVWFDHLVGQGTLKSLL